MKRNKERILLAASTFILAVMAWQFLGNIRKNNIEVSDGYKSFKIINLDRSIDQKKLKRLLSNSDYFSDNEYERFASNKLKEKLTTYELENLGSLNKEEFMVNAEEMGINGGEYGNNRYKKSCVELGQDSAMIAKVDTMKLLATKIVSSQKTALTISGKITIERDKGNINKIKYTLGLKKDIPAANVIVRLTEEMTQSDKDSIMIEFLSKMKAQDDKSELYQVDLDNFIPVPDYYAVTDENGNYAFTNLERGKNYSVIPIQKGKEYGIIKGIAKINKSAKNINFIEKEHKLTLLDGRSFAQIKKDKIFTVRTPDDFKSDFFLSVFLLFVGYWFFHIVLSFKKEHFEEMILPILMLLSGIGLIVLYAIQDPLRDLDYGSRTARSIFFVLIAISGTVLIKKKWLKKQLNRFLYATWKNYIWLFLSIFLILLLAVFGSGPEGSGVKVNLFHVQVSELSKFIMIVFFAYFFTVNHSYLRDIDNNRYIIKRYTIGMLLGFIFLLVLYVVAVGDQGPAIVLFMTFLIFYSYGKNEFALMILAGAAYGILLFILHKLLGNSGVSAIISVVLLVGLFLYSWKMRKNESMFFIVLLMAAFVILPSFNQIPFVESMNLDFIDRLADRNSMFANKWENPLHGGDQVAQGVWALNSGGWMGQGLGKGMSNVMPAYHTDMIFESIGEELGTVSLICILLLFGFLFFRLILVARRTGNRFVFYLIYGIATVTLVQFTVIVGGSLGLIPLTGISVPFLSMGNSGLMTNLAAFLFVIILSQIRGNENETNDIRKNFDNLNVYSTSTFIGILGLFSITLMIYLFTANNTMIRSVVVLSKQGEWTLSENPRISIIRDKLKAGNIYDRNGVLLATSNRDTFLISEEIAKNNYANMTGFEKQKNSFQKRYYPFSDDLIYWLGDANSGLVANEMIGYVAEYRLASKLRGINVPYIQSEDSIKMYNSDEFREAPYLPKEERNSVLKRYDYSNYRKFLKTGVESKLIENENSKKNKNIYLTLDVKLNQLINEVIRGEKYKDYKVSAVAIKSNSGDVLASAINPAPNKDDIRKIVQIRPKFYDMLLSVYFGYNHMVADRDFGIFYRSVPGSTIKALDALAFMSRVGVGGADTTYYFVPEEVIRTGSDPYGYVDMKKAIVKSSNNYFISLMNLEELHPELFKLYNNVGINIINKYGYFISNDNSYNEDDAEARWYQHISKNKGVNFFNPNLQRTKDKYKGASDYSWIAWGQSSVEATPLHMARIFGAIANHGPLYANKFLLKDSEGMTPDKLETNLEVKRGINAKLESFLKEQDNSLKVSNKNKITVYGKTGSPEREVIKYDRKTGSRKVDVVTDGWYVFYIKNSIYNNSPIALAIRIQEKGGSRYAVEIANQIIEKMKAHKIFN